MTTVTLAHAPRVNNKEWAHFVCSLLEHVRQCYIHIATGTAYCKLTWCVCHGTLWPWCTCTSLRIIWHIYLASQCCLAASASGAYKTLRIESPPSVKHLRTTKTPKLRLFAVSRPPHVNLLLDQIFVPCYCKAPPLVWGWRHCWLCQWALWCSVQLQRSREREVILVRVEWLPVTSCSQTDRQK